MLAENYSLLHRNTFGIEARARYFFEYDSVQSLTEFLQTDLATTQPLLHIGGGSNLLFVSDFKGVVLHSCIRGIELQKETSDEVFVRAGAGVVWDDFVQYCVEHEWGGVENLSFIPGEVGASPVQNIGAYGVEAKDVIFEVEAVEVKTGAPRIFSNQACEFGYRDSIFKQRLRGQYIVTNVVFRLAKNPTFKLDYQSLRAEVEALGAITLKNVREAVIKTRRAKLPDVGVIGSAGSFFINPVISAQLAELLRADYPTMPQHVVADGVKLSAGWLIEQCGWKGFSRGAVGVYDKQALVLINKGGGTGAEIADLAQQIQHSVAEKFGVLIKSEVIFV